MLNYFKEVTTTELAAVAGGTCQCNCNRKIEGGDSVTINIGKAKTLEECSNVCLANGWKIDACIEGAKKEAK